MANAQKTYELLVKRLKELGVLDSVGAVLGWDERTQLPEKGAEARAEQMSLIARLRHEMFTSAEIGNWLGEIEGSDLVKDRESDAAVNVRETRHSYDRAAKLPSSLVEELTKMEVLAQHAWVEARKGNNYAAFEPWLAKTLELKRQQADCYGGGAKRYDQLLEDFEPGETATNLQRVFAELRQELVPLVGAIAQSGKEAPAEILERKYPAAQQEKLAKIAAKAVGFDFAGGRLDVSVHPFSTGIAPGDARITTRYDENYFGDAFFGTLHEAGHSMYSQGLPAEHFGTPRGEDISLGIHESQSRMWENLVGRSRSFWEYFLPIAKEHFPEVLKDVSLEQWYFAVNDVKPSLIRTESDEATYNLHVMVRFELEQALLSGDLPTKDLPAAWNGKMTEYLGVDVPDDARGCLQDIHWSGGAIGYFPTYTLGNLYAAQFFEQAKKDVGNLDGQFARGEFAGLLGWLREKIHSQGKKYRATELVNRVTGKPLSAEALMRHLKKKAGELYGV
ncbi:MAG TPA: carboxypeptidase M32 [Tepidisphaeraceae bacterium]|jgi:carboxypeptidase Taq|nr:carboxypeptidase M32 [Tepidisphaeraceae bacterium]